MNSENCDESCRFKLKHLQKMHLMVSFACDAHTSLSLFRAVLYVREVCPVTSREQNRLM
jgi:hypothetical protein